MQVIFKFNKEISYIAFEQNQKKEIWKEVMTPTCSRCKSVYRSALSTWVQTEAASGKVVLVSRYYKLYCAIL